MKNMKGVLICGGFGTRLRPLTEITNKSLLPVYDRPLIHYPLDVLIQANIREIAVVTGPEHIDQIASYLASGNRFGCTFTYTIQDEPRGLAHALSLVEAFAMGESVCALLGDNIFFDDLSPAIQSFREGALLFLKEVPDPKRFGVAELESYPTKETDAVRILSVEEKPQHPKSSYALTGCYVFDSHCFDYIRKLQPSARGELEITDLSRKYLEHDALRASLLHKPWVDAGTFESLFLASQLVRETRSHAATP